MDALRAVTQLSFLLLGEAIELFPHLTKMITFLNFCMIFLFCAPHIHCAWGVCSHLPHTYRGSAYMSETAPEHTGSWSLLASASPNVGTKPINHIVGEYSKPLPNHPIAHPILSYSCVTWPITTSHLSGEAENVMKCDCFVLTFTLLPTKCNGFVWANVATVLQPYVTLKPRKSTAFSHEQNTRHMLSVGRK